MSKHEDAQRLVSRILEDTNVCEKSPIVLTDLGADDQARVLAGLRSLESPLLGSEEQPGDMTEPPL
jgi:hypothetical protein